MRPQQLDPKPLLIRHGMSPLSLSACPECKKSFVAGEGVMFLAPFTRNGEEYQGYMTFCSLEHVLAWFQPSQMGKA